MLRNRKTLNEKTPKQSQFITRRVISQGDLNPNSTLFGGVMMSWMDEVAFQSARKYSGRPFCVTVNIDNIVFLDPLKLGETVVLTSQVNYVGKSSMEIGVRVEKEDPYSGALHHTNSAYLTFVALNEKSQPAEVPRLKLETEEDFRRHTEALIRVKVRNRMKAAMKRKLGKTLSAEPVKKEAKGTNGRSGFSRKYAVESFGQVLSNFKNQFVLDNKLSITAAKLFSLYKSPR